MSIQQQSHAYKFVVTGSTPTEELIAELQKADNAVGQPTQANFTWTQADQRDQRESSYLTITVSQVPMPSGRGL